MSPMKSVLVPVFAVLLASCSVDDSGDSSGVFRHFSIDNGSVAVHAQGVADAVVDAGGNLTIAGKSVSTSAAQRQLLARYHDSILTLRNAAVAAGKAGIKTAGKAIGSVIAGLASGNPDKIDAQVNAQAGQVAARVAELCGALREIRSTQDAIAAQIEAFRPYATISAEDVDHCQ